ncbi:MAG: hypothetical protein LWW77_12390 [Propionibacteriales bacterium]|nr:hypothetical protein [Propionibacteriales bacterium]
MIALAIVAVVVVGGLMLVHASLSGRDVRQPPPSLTDAPVSTRLEAAKTAMTADVAEISAPLGLRPGQTGSQAGCEQGQHNFKINTDYDYSCTVRVGRFYGWSGDFPTFLTKLDTQLNSLGWSSGRDPKQDIKRYNDDVQRRIKAGMSAKDAKAAVLDEAYSVSYHRGPDWVDISFAGSVPQNPRSSWMYLSDEVNSRAAVEELLGDGPVVLVTEHREFFRV